MYGLRLTTAALLLAVPAARARAQAAPDTLPFHAGQWGVEAPLGGGGSGVGALRFFSRATALTLNLVAAHNTTTINAQSTTGGESPTVSNDNVSFNLGVRHYAAVQSSLAGFFTVGGTVAYGHSHSDPGSSTFRQTGFGGFADVGVSYFITRHLTFSGSYGASGLYFRSRASSPAPFPATRSHSSTFQLGGVRAVAGIVF